MSYVYAIVMKGGETFWRNQYIDDMQFLDDVITGKDIFAVKRSVEEMEQELKDRGYIETEGKKSKLYNVLTDKAMKEWSEGYSPLNSGIRTEILENGQWQKGVPKVKGSYCFFWVDIDNKVIIDATGNTISPDEYEYTPICYLPSDKNMFGWGWYRISLPYWEEAKRLSIDKELLENAIDRELSAVRKLLYGITNYNSGKRMIVGKHTLSIKRHSLSILMKRLDKLSLGLTLDHFLSPRKKDQN